MSAKPSGNGENGRASNGQFAKGNPGGPGNPHARRTAELRAELLKTLGPDQLRAIIAQIVKIAADPAVPAAVRLAACVELLDRVLGKPATSDVLERMEALEERMEELLTGLSQKGRDEVWTQLPRE
jgi:hypothetical protein